MALNLKQRRYAETVIAGLPHLAEAVAAIPPDRQPAAFQTAERSYLKAFRQVELSGPQTWVSSVMRRLRRRVREAEKEKLTKLYEHLSANEHGSVMPFGQAHSFVPHQAALSEDQKKVGGELSADEQNQEYSFATLEAASSEGQNVGGELSADEQVGEEHSFATHEPASSEEQKNVARESVKKDAVALRMARIMIRVGEIFDDGRHPMVDKQSSNRRTHSIAPKADAGRAEDCFKRAILVAHQQQAKSRELRTAMSLARLWRDQGKAARSVRTACSGLRLVYGGFDTRDLKEAKALLEE
jgi:hypothetical protein